LTPGEPPATRINTTSQGRVGAFGFLKAARHPHAVSVTCAAAACALAPAYVIRWHVLSYPTTLLEVAILLTVAAFVIETAWRRSSVMWRGPLTAPAGIFLLAGAISIVVAADHRGALGLFRAYLVEPMAFAVVVVTVVTSRQRALMLLAGLAVGGLVAGLANSVVVLAALRAHTLDVTLTPPVVIYNTANAVALYLVPLIAISASLSLHATQLRERLVSGVFTVLAALAVLLSFSRGGYLALAAVAVGLAVSHRLRWWLTSAGAVALGLLLLIPPFFARVRAEVDLNSGRNTLVGRFHLWDAALQMLRNRPLFGAGLSGFAAAIAPYWNPTHTDRFTYPHNILLNFWSETGLLGVVAFGWIVVAALRLSLRGWRQSGSDWRPIHLGVLLAIVAVLVHGLVDVPYFKNDLSLEFWTLVAVSWSGVYRLTSPPTGERRTAGSKADI
jgi:O-antigen ligase